jgi:hypothetical protein
MHTKNLLWTTILRSLCCFPAFLTAQFSGPIIIDADFNGNLIHAVDLDLDGDTDLLTAGTTGRRWYENDGQGGFSRHDLPGSTNTYYMVLYDPAFASTIWHHNNAGNGFAEGAVLLQPYSKLADAADVDGDGRIDLLTRDNGFIVWHHNLGEAQFAADTITSNAELFPRPHSYRFTDLDGDHKPDLHVIMNDGALVWFQNTVINRLDNVASKSSFSISPNPARSTLRLLTAVSLPAGSYLQVLRLTDPQVLLESPLSGKETTVDLTGLAAGTYLLIVHQDGEIRFRGKFIHLP